MQQTVHTRPSEPDEARTNVAQNTTVCFPRRTRFVLDNMGADLESGCGVVDIFFLPVACVGEQWMHNCTRVRRDQTSGRRDDNRCFPVGHRVSFGHCREIYVDLK